MNISTLYAIMFRELAHLNYMNHGENFMCFLSRFIVMQESLGFLKWAKRICCLHVENWKKRFIEQGKINN